MSKHRILVVDDDESLRRVMQMQLEEAGYEVLVACQGADGLNLIEDITPDLVITDLKMPGISGLDLLRKLREAYPETTVIMITAFGTVSTAVEAMKAGAYDYITKPVDYEQFILVVNRAMERGQTKPASCNCWWMATITRPRASKWGWAYTLSRFTCVTSMRSCRSTPRPRPWPRPCVTA